MNARPHAHDDLRKSLLGKVHIAKKQIDLDDDAYRDIIERLFGCRSAADLSPQQLVQLVEELKRKGFRDMKRAAPKPAVPGKQRRIPDNASRETSSTPNAAIVSKLRALWLSLYNLGLVEDRKDSALLAFVKRQTRNASPDGKGTQALAWLPPQEAFRAVEALKSWAAREGVNWEAFKDPRECVLAAQAAKCMKLGIYGAVVKLSGLSLTDDDKIARLGDGIREALGGKRP